MAGNKNSGRTKGSVSRQTTAVKQCLLNAFEDIGGVKNLAKWATENQTEFYKLWVKVLPLTIAGDKDNPFVVHDITDRPYERSGQEWLNTVGVHKQDHSMH